MILTLFIFAIYTEIKKDGKNLNYKKILILSTPISFLVGPLILEIILIITSITFLYDEKKETLKII